MTKPHDQTWRVGRKVPRHIYRADDDSVVGTLDREEDARLASAAPEMARLLLEVETISVRSDIDCCPFCDAWQPFDQATKKNVVDHRADCAWLMLMKKAGLR